MTLRFDEFVERTGSGYVLPKGVPSATFSFKEATHALMDYHASWQRPHLALKFYASFFPDIDDEQSQSFSFRRTPPSDAALAQLEKTDRFRNGLPLTYSHLNRQIATCEHELQTTETALSALKDLFISINPPGYCIIEIDIHREWDTNTKPSSDKDDICKQLIMRAQLLQQNKSGLKVAL